MPAWESVREIAAVVFQVPQASGAQLASVRRAVRTLPVPGASGARAAVHRPVPGARWPLGPGGRLFCAPDTQAPTSRSPARSAASP
ncbi:hypothetical protein ACFVXG_38145 [Kitasatospora sp. NPDC058162]|uniref:hypothetical protein n=1 Tax=Kitasatospora sp. NPDC058162 TaxID=3346362 RepID=UPI0036DF9C3B